MKTFQFYPVTILIALAALALSTLQESAWSSDQPDPKKAVNTDSGVGLHGYDPVSYFQKGGPQKGVEKITSTQSGVTYQFASAEDKAAFEKTPEKYLPQYGGWCAYAMANAEYVDVDPKTFKLIDGKLYLFYNGLWGNTLEKWNPKESELKPKADAGWLVLNPKASTK